MSLICPTRDALVAFLNAQSLTPDVPAVAAWEETADLEALAGGRVLVIANRPSSEMLTYDGVNDRQPQIDVIVQYKSATLTTTEMDPYVSLSEAIADLVLGATLSNATQCINVEWPDGAIVHSDLQDFQVLTIRQTLTFILDT